MGQGWGSHRRHVVCPLAVPSLQPLRCVEVVDDPHHITHPEGVVLSEREACEGSPRSVWLPRLGEQEAPPSSTG